jgi:hypothetical protein
MAAIDDYKEPTMATASRKMARVGNLLESDLAYRAGVRGLVGLCLRASVDKVLATQDAANMAVGLLLLRLGGSRVAEIGHRALGLPSVSTLRRYTTIRPLLPSPGMPLVEEIECNIDSCLDATAKSQGTSLRIVHQALRLQQRRGFGTMIGTTRLSVSVVNTGIGFRWICAQKKILEFSAMV